MTYIVNVKTDKANSGCFASVFPKLDDELRSFVKASAASLRRDSRNPDLRVIATIFKSGTSESRNFEA